MDADAKPLSSGPQSPPRRRAVLFNLGRGVALFVGLFSLVNLLGEWRLKGFDANEWWIDLRPWPDALAQTLLALLGGLLVGWAIRPGGSRLRRRSTGACAVLAAAACLLNVAQFYYLVSAGRIRPGTLIPFSLAVAVVLVLLAMATQVRVAPPSRLTAICVGFLVCVVLLPLAQMISFGRTDYRRPAHAVVVFGARAYANGEPSQALADRVRTGMELYQAGLVGKLIFSGGPGDGTIHETAAMRTFAMSLGVPETAILLDARGLSTEDTVRNTPGLLDRPVCHGILAVSHAYHLPRIRMAYRRVGMDVWTVPARETRPLVGMPKFMAREVAALWVYYLRPLAPGGPAWLG